MCWTNRPFLSLVILFSSSGSIVHQLRFLPCDYNRPGIWRTCGAVKKAPSRPSSKRWGEPLIEAQAETGISIKAREEMITRLSEDRVSQQTHEPSCTWVSRFGSCCTLAESTNLGNLTFLWNNVLRLCRPTIRPYFWNKSTGQGLAKYAFERKLLFTSIPWQMTIRPKELNPSTLRSPTRPIRIQHRVSNELATKYRTSPRENRLNCVQIVFFTKAL